MEFKQSKHVLVAAKYIIGNSEQNSSFTSGHSQKSEVHFHAVAGMTQALLERWPSLSVAQISETRSYLLEYCIHITEYDT